MTIQIIAGIITLCLWYIYLCLDCALNGGYWRDGNPWFIPLWIVWEYFLCALPVIGRKKKGDYIREIVDQKRDDGTYYDGAMCAETGSWDYEEIRRDNLYEKVGCAMLPGFWYFAGVNVIGPLIVYVGLYKLMEFLVYLFGRIFP